MRFRRSSAKGFGNYGGLDFIRVDHGGPYVD